MTVQPVKFSRMLVETHPQSSSLARLSLVLGDRTKLAPDYRWLNELIYRKILVPYDISNPSDNALEHAIRLKKASPNETEIILLHVIEVPILPVIEQAIKSRKDSKLTAFEEHTEYVYSSIKKEVIKKMDEKKRNYEQAGLRIKADVVKGKPVDMVLEYAEKEGVELIIMGNVGLGGSSKLTALGSVSRGVLERSKCPVMIIR